MKPITDELEPAHLTSVVGGDRNSQAVVNPAIAGSFPPALKLERSLPLKGVDLRELRARDLARERARLSRRVLAAGVVDFPVEGSANPFTVGLYFTRVKLGNPSKEFYVQIDTGSDILWVNCDGCNGCPTSSGLSIQLEFFDPQKSSSASLIGCSDQRCSSALQSGEAACPASDSSMSQCSYTFQYGDGSGTSGYYVSDTLYFDTVTENEQSANSSANVIFGCSNSQSGDLTKPDRAVDGIFGFGQHELSVISQLSSAGVSPKVFSHCLKGSDNGGGILVLGKIVEPGIVYTQLVQSQPHYNLNLLSILVNGQELNIDSSVFSTSTTQGTIVDSGTTLAYLAEQAYDPFVDAIISSLQPSLVQSFNSKGNQCFVTASSADDVFPPVTLNFAGGASMNLKPSDYLIQQGSVNGAIIWCIGWQKNQGGVTILGDLVLKDKIFVYDLANQRIGWTNYDCSLSVNVSSSSGKNEFVNTGQLDLSGSLRNVNYSILPMGLVVFLLHVFVSHIKQLQLM
ncbi:aspartic proteinase-like protein 2 [Asparagus officinalis]|uniref:aspartic proteinase-like protein 2 n=1 Tax=Asparagus officinalis TaxID=4686 RepID=UPI00098E5338|nr:aspartic proteinase-like protein 2 [Asparagus officinalis]